LPPEQNLPPCLWVKSHDSGFTAEARRREENGFFIRVAAPHASALRIISAEHGGNTYPQTNLIHYQWEGGGDDGGEGVSKLERLGGDSDDNGLRAATIQLLGAGEQPGGRAIVGKR
jgi:hypothetical protein